jgi:hypothetical protein
MHPICTVLTHVVVLGVALPGLVPATASHRVIEEPEQRQAVGTRQRTAQRAAPVRKSKSQILAILRTVPGGSRALSLAGESGVKTTPPKPNNPGGLANPDVPFDLHFYPGHLNVLGNSMVMKAVDVSKDGDFRLYKAPQSASRAIVSCVFPESGWYIFNLDGVVPPGVQVKATLKQGVGLGPALQTWTVTNTASQPQSRSFPAVFQDSGSGSLLFAIEAGELVFEQATVEPL